MALAGHVAAVCFDLDGVLIRTMLPLHAAAWLSVASRWGLSVSRREIYTWEGEPGLVHGPKTAWAWHRRAGKADLGAVGQAAPA